MYEDYKAIGHMLQALAYEAETYGIQIGLGCSPDDPIADRKPDEIREALDRLSEKLNAIEKYWSIA